jgi:CCR4-NOT transcription complex subunit 2
MNLNQGGLENRFAQFSGGQGQPGSTGGFATLSSGGIQGLQNLTTGNFNMTSPLQPGRPGGMGIMPGVGGGHPSMLNTQQRIGGTVPSGMQQQLNLQGSAGARLGVVGQQFSSGMNGIQGMRGGVPGMGGSSGMPPSLSGLQSQQQQTQHSGIARPSGGGIPGIGGLSGPNVTNLAALQQQQQHQQQQRALSGLTALGTRSGTLAGVGSGYGAPSGDLLTMLNKAGGPGRPQDEGPAFNASDFPSLSAAGGGQQRHASEDGANESFAALLSNQKAPPPTGPAPSFGEDDFPALPGAGAGVGGPMPRHDGTQGAAQLAQLQQQMGGLGIAAGGVDASLEALRLQQQQQQQQQQRMQQQQQQAALKPANGGKPMMPHGSGGAATMTGQAQDRFGLLGLLPVIRMIDDNVTTLALGIDLTTLGLNLNAPEALWKTFSSPWTDRPGKVEPDFRLPTCYLHPPPRLQPAHFALFSRDTLFYIFYGMPGDEAQLYAADQLASRGWYFHKELKAWLTRVPDTEPLQTTDRFEQGSFYIFDPTTWELLLKDNFTVSFDALERLPGMAKPTLADGQVPPPAGMQGAS